VKGFDISRAQGQRLIDRLPPNVELRPLCVTEVAVPLFALSIPEFQTVSPREIPGRPGYRNADFLEDGPGIATAARRLEVGRASGLPGLSQRIRLIGEGIAQVHTADRETDCASRQVKEITSESEVFCQEHRILDLVGGNENLILHLPRILADAEWIEGRCRIGIEQPVTQGVVVRNAAEPDGAVAFIVAEAGFPFPGLQLVPSVGELAQIAFETGGKQIVIGSNFKGAQTGFQRTITNAGGELRPRRRRTLLRERRERGTKPTVGGVVRGCKRVERVLCRHTDTDTADTECVAPNGRASREATKVRPDVRRERRRRQTTIPNLADIFEVSKYGQVFVANIAVERAVEIFSVGGGDCWRQIREVKERALARDRRSVRKTPVRVLRVLLLVCGEVRRRGS